jgi:hypothetical protein
MQALSQQGLAVYTTEEVAVVIKLNLLSISWIAISSTALRAKKYRLADIL